MSDFSYGGFWQTVKPELDPDVNPDAANEYYNIQYVSSRRSSALPNPIIRGGVIAGRWADRWRETT